MQVLGAYSLEAKVNADDAKSRLAFFEEEVTKWLRRKGAIDPSGAEGEFISKSGDGTGLFSRKIIATSLGELHEIHLEEAENNGDLFTTDIRFCYFSGSVTVFASLRSEPAEVTVTAAGPYPRCPAIIRSLIDSYSDWSLGGQPAPSGKSKIVRSEEETFELCDYLFSEKRRLPLIVVSSDPQGAVWAGLSNELAHQLIGLAQVVDIDAKAGWALSEELERRDSCYLGAVRLYWPGVRRDGRLLSQLWTSERQLTFKQNEAGKNRFLSLMRKNVLTIAALTVAEPREMKEVRLLENKERTVTNEVDELKKIIKKLEGRCTDLEAEIESAKQKHAHTKHEFAAYRQEHGREDQEDAANDIGSSPQSGDIRYYKKVSGDGPFDRMVRRGNCNHTSWASAFDGDKAEKGIAKLEGSRNWKNIYKCLSCKGGGFWRVTW